MVFQTIEVILLAKNLVEDRGGFVSEHLFIAVASSGQEGIDVLQGIERLGEQENTASALNELLLGAEEGNLVASGYKGHGCFKGRSRSGSIKDLES